MQLSRISLDPYRPRVTRIPPKERTSMPVTNSYNSFFVSSSNQWINRKQSKIMPEFGDSSLKFKTQLNKNKQRKKPYSHQRVLCIVCLTIIGALLVSALIGLLLAFELPHKTTLSTTTTTDTSTTTTTVTTVTTTTKTTTTTSTTTSTSSTSTTSSTTTTTKTTSTTSTTTTSTTTTKTTTTTSTTTTTTATTTPSCTNPSAAGRIFTLATASAPIIYTLYTYGFTANDSSSTLTFAITGDSGPAQHYWLLDSVSVNHTNVGSNILTNGGFETGDLTGWTQYCATNANCGTNDYGQLTNSPCYSGTHCYMDMCSPATQYDYLIQSFPTVIGDYYLISFYLRAFANGGPHMAYVMLT